MADNPVLPATGVAVAGDDLGSGLIIQRVKPSIGPDGSAVDLQYGQQAKSACLPVIGASDILATVDADLAGSSGSYVFGDQMGTLLTMAAGLTTGQQVEFRDVEILDGNAVAAPMLLNYFSGSITLASDSAADAISDADNLTCIGQLWVPGFSATSNNRKGRIITGLPLPLTCGTSGNIYLQVVAQATIGTTSTATLRFRHKVYRF